MNPNLRHQVHYGTLQVHGNAAAMNSNLQYGNAQAATFFPSNMPNPKVYNQQASVMVNNQGFVAMNMDGFDAGQGQRIVGMQGTMAAQMQGAISMTANISPQFNNGGGGHSFNMTNGAMIPGSMMSTPGNMMQSSPGNILQASPNIMQTQNNIPVMQTSNNMVQGPTGNMMQFYKGMNPGMMNSPNGLSGMNFSPQSSSVLPSFSQLFGTCSPGSQFQNPNQQQVHQGTVINPGNAGGFENFVQNVVVNTPAPHVQHVQQVQQLQQQHPLGQTFVNVYNQRQPVNTNAVNVNHFTCMPYKQGENVFMMTPANLNNKFNSTMPVATVASHARPDCRFSGPGSVTNPGNIHVPISQPANIMDHSQTRQLVTQASTMVTTTVYSHANVTCSSVSSGPHSQCVVQRPSQSICGHNHLTSDRAPHCALVSRPSSVNSYNTIPAILSQCRTKPLDNGKQLMSSSTTVSLPSTHQDTSLSFVKCNSESEIVLPTTTASSTITSTTVSTEGPVCPKTSKITVPFGWRRVVEQGVIIYYSPSDHRLQSSECVRQYLQSDGTCKCGLECPLLVDEMFSFDAHLKSKPWEVTDVTCKTDLKKFCNHKRKTIAMATLKNSQSMQDSLESTEKNNNEPENFTTVSASSSQAVKKEGKKKKKGNKNKSGSGPYDGVLVSELLAQRDKSRTSPGRNSLHVPLSKELSSLIDAALGNTGSSSKKQSTDDTHKKDSLVDAKVERGVHKTSVPGEKTLALPASKQTNTCSNVLKHVEKRDPMDDLGPITCHVPGKLDFSLGRPMSNCQHMFNRSPMLSPGLPNNSCLPPNPSHNNPLSIQTSFGQDAYKNQRIFLQSPPCNTGPNTPCEVPMQMPGYAISDQMPQGYSVDHGGVMIPEQMMNMQSPVRFPAAFNQSPQTGNPYHCGPPQHPYMPLSSIRNNLSAPWLEQRTKPKRPRPKAKKKERRKVGERLSPCPNIDVRSMHIPTDAGAGNGNTPAPMASFLDNPTAFLAHQTALVHNSMASTSQGLHSAPGGIVDCINKNILPSQALSNKGSIESYPSDENKKTILNHEQNTLFSQPESGSLLTCKSEPQDTSPATSVSTSNLVTCTTNSNSQGDPEDKKPPDIAICTEETTTIMPKEEHMLGTEVKSNQQPELSESSNSCNTNSGGEHGENIKTSTLSEDHIQKTDTISGEKRKTSVHHKTKESKNLKHTLKKPSGNFPASTLLSAAARAQLASQIQSHVNSKVYMKSNSTSPCSRMSTSSGCPLNNTSNCEPDGSASVHPSYPKNRFDGQKLNVSRNDKMISSPLITQCCLGDNPSKTLNGYNNLYGGMNQPLSYLSSEFSKEQSPIQMVQNVVASIDGKSEMFKPNFLNTGLSVMSDASNPRQKDTNPLLQELSMDMGKSVGSVQDPAYKASLQHLVNQALLQQGLSHMNSLPLGGHMPLLGVGSGLPSGTMPGLAPITPNNNLSQMIPTMGLTQPVIAQQPLLQLISTLNLNTNNPMLLASPSLNSPNQNPIAGNLSTPQMMGVSISRPQVPNNDGTYGIDSLAQTSTPVQVNQPDPQFDQNYPAMDIKNSEDLKTSTGTLMDGINQNPATCPAQLVLLPQLQMPMVQMMGPNQMQINSNCMEKNNINNINLNLNMTQMVVPGQAATPQNIGMFSPNLANNNLNLFNLQQMMNLCSATNVTTAQLQQLQCLQLQQQLLQQYMQTLINQLGVHGTVNNSTTHPEKQESDNSEAITQHGADTNSGEKNISSSVKETQESSDKCPGQEDQSHALETTNLTQDHTLTGEGTYEPESDNGVKTGSEDHHAEENQNADIVPESLDDSCESQQKSEETNDKETPCIHGSNKTEESNESAPVSCDLEKEDLSTDTIYENNEISVSPNSDKTASKDVEPSKSLTENVNIGETVIDVSLDSNNIDHSYEGMAVDSIPETESIEAGSSQTESVTKSIPDTDSSTNYTCDDYNFPDVPSNETDSLTGDQGLEVCDGPTTGDQLMVMANGPPTDQEYRHEDTSSLDGLSSSEDEKIDEIFANHRGLKRVLRDNRDSILDDEDSLDFDDKVIGVFPRNFNVGDLVWGQIRGFPSWPGKLVHENQVKGTPKTEDGKLWVKWFGDHTCTQVEPDKLKTLSEGLEAHHRARKKYRKGRKMNSHLESAIQEAMNELDRPTENVEPVSQTNRYVKGRPVKKRRTR